MVRVYAFSEEAVRVLIPRILLLVGLGMAGVGFGLMQLRVEEIRDHSCMNKEMCGMLLYNAPYGMFGYKVMIYGIGLAVASAITIVYSLENVKKDPLTRSSI